MRKRIAGLLGCLLMLGAVSQAQVAPRELVQAARMQFTEDGSQLLATVLQKRDTTATFSAWTLISWDVKSERQLSRIALPKGLPRDTVFSPDGRLFYQPSGQGEGKKIELFDTATGQAVREWKIASPFTTRPLKFSADGKLLAVDRFKNVRMSTVPPIDPLKIANRFVFWDIDTGKQVPLFGAKGKDEHLSTTLFSANNRLVVRVGSKDVETNESRPWVVVFDRHTGQRLNSFFIEERVLHGYLLSPDGRTLVGFPEFAPYSRPSPQIPLWNTQTGKLLHSLPQGPEPVEFVKLQFSADSSQLSAFGISYQQKFRNPFVAQQSHWKQTWSVASGQELSNAALPIEGIYFPATLRQQLTDSASSDRLFARVNQNKIQLYEQESGKLMWEREVEFE